MINLYSILPKKNNLSASCERVAGRPTAAILDASQDGAIAGGLVETFDKKGLEEVSIRTAKEHPGQVRGVVSLVTPFSGCCSRIHDATTGFWNFEGKSLILLWQVLDFPLKPIILGGAEAAQHHATIDTNRWWT